MTSLDDPSAELSRVHAPPGGVVVLQLEHVDNLIDRCPEQYGTLIECAAFVNWRRIELGEPAVLALSFYKHR